MSKNTRTLLRGGTVVTATDVVLADIAVLGEKVLGVLAPGSELSESFARGAEIVVDASGQFISPKKQDILVGCTLRVVERLLQKCNIAIQYRDVQPSDLANASEILLTGSTGGVWFANTFDGTRIGTGTQRKHFQKVSQLWKEHVGMDYVAHAVAKASANERIVLH